MWGSDFLGRIAAGSSDFAGAIGISRAKLKACGTLRGALRRLPSPVEMELFRLTLKFAARPQRIGAAGRSIFCTKLAVMEDCR